MATASSSSCIVDAKVEISYEPLTEPWSTVDQWVVLPAMQKVTKSYNETQAGKTRHSASGSKFVTPCGASTRSEVFTFQMLFCNDDPITWYLKDGDEVFWRITKGTSGDAALYTRKFKGKYIDNGDTWDNTTEDGEEITFTVEATSSVVMSHKAASPTNSKQYGAADGSHVT